MPKRIVITKLGGPEVLKYEEYKLPITLQKIWYELNIPLLELIL